MECLNCDNKNQNKDIYCRQCGIKITKPFYYVIVNILIFIFSMLAVGIIALFIASFFV